MCLFSVIIPVFNTKTDYLKKCIESVKTQSFNDYEILVINDGSNRESTNKYIEYLKDKNDNKIKIFEQSNKGVSSARNL